MSDGWGWGGGGGDGWYCMVGYMRYICDNYFYIFLGLWDYIKGFIFIMQRSLIQRVGSILPGLHNKGYKGDNGRIGVIGGSY